MAQFVRIPPESVEAALLASMLEEYASRDGTDYGVSELSLEEKVARLRTQLSSGKLAIVYDLASAHWDLLYDEQLAELEL